MLRNIIMLMAPKTFAFTFGGGDLRTAALAAGWAGDSLVVATVSATVYDVSVSGSFPHGVNLINNGVLAGSGGSRGTPGDWAGYPNTPGNPGGAGGTGLTASVAVTVTNNGVIAAGGGGGGGGASSRPTSGLGVLGGGLGGLGGPYGGSPESGFSGQTSGTTYGGNGGNGGSYNTAGAAGGASYGWDDTLGYVTEPGGAGGAAGNSVTGNSNITWLATGTRIGTIA